MPVSKSNPKLVVEEGTVQAERAQQYPKGRVIFNPEETGVAKRVQTHRFRHGKLVAKNGVPVAGAKLEALEDVESYDISDADVYYDAEDGQYYTDPNFYD